MFQLIAQRRIGRFMLTDSISQVPNERAQTEIDYRMIGEDFHYGEEMGAVFGLGLKMKALEACVHELAS